MLHAILLLTELSWEFHNNALWDAVWNAQLVSSSHVTIIAAVSKYSATSLIILHTSVNQNYR